MGCRVTEMRDKEVICVKDGTRLGHVYDVEIDTCSGRLVAIVIQGKSKAFGLLGHENDIVIDWEQIEVIGEDTILVRGECCNRPSPPPHPKNDLLERVIGG